MACDDCGARRGHKSGCPRLDKQKQKEKREKLAQRRTSRRGRGPGGFVPRPGKNYGQPCPPHNPKRGRAVGPEDPQGNRKHQWRCGKCKKRLGSW